ncbi:MAG: dTDP-4-dehydrorhamnose reductase [Anaerolineae bacterium]|nr:dTDP-4-dehydrorhamnose reductase [Anaerolineae bacterium]
MRILVTGAQGRLGSCLVALLSVDYPVVGVDRDVFDITDQAQVQAAWQHHQPDLVIHCAAFTQVDEAARQPELAWRINALGTKHVVLACLAMGSRLLYVSTNEVFDGSNPAGILEYAPAAPINPYGYSKWIGEQFVRDHLQHFYIVRSSWLFAHGGNNFVQAILARARSGQPLRVVVNEVASPTYNDDLAVAMVALIKTEQYGIYHLVNEGRASRWQLARTVLDLAGYAQVEIQRIAAAEYERASIPPEYSVLENTMAAALGIRLRPWEAALQAYLAREGLLA